MQRLARHSRRITRTCLARTAHRCNVALHGRVWGANDWEQSREAFSENEGVVHRNSHGIIAPPRMRGFPPLFRPSQLDFYRDSCPTLSYQLFIRTKKLSWSPKGRVAARRVGLKGEAKTLVLVVSLLERRGRRSSIKMRVGFHDRIINSKAQICFRQTG